MSGTAPTLTQEELANFDGQRVEIEGKLVDYESLPFESEYVLARKLLGGKVVPNWCFGEKVLLADSIRIR